MPQISPRRAATRGAHCRPPGPPASLSLFAVREEGGGTVVGPTERHSRCSEGSLFFGLDNGVHFTVKHVTSRVLRLQLRYCLSGILHSSVNDSVAELLLNTLEEARQLRWHRRDRSLRPEDSDAERIQGATLDLFCLLGIEDCVD